MGILENKSRARLFYKYLSKVYDRVNPFIWNEEMRAEALDLLEFDDDPMVLDVGCGTGFGTEGLLEPASGPKASSSTPTTSTDWTRAPTRCRRRSRSSASTTR